MLGCTVVVSTMILPVSDVLLAMMSLIVEVRMASLLTYATVSL